MSALSVPKIVKPRADTIVGLTDAVCRTHLTDEYAALARELAVALARKRPSPLMRGHCDTWACGVMYTIGAVNFLFDPAQTPHVKQPRAVRAVRRQSKRVRGQNARDPADLRHQSIGSSLVPSEQTRGQPAGMADPCQWRAGRHSDDAARTSGAGL